jgi:hypothetical protein
MCRPLQDGQTPRPLQEKGHDEPLAAAGAQRGGAKPKPEAKV